LLLLEKKDYLIKHLNGFKIIFSLGGNYELEGS